MLACRCESSMPIIRRSSPSPAPSWRQFSAAFDVLHDIGSGCPTPEEFARRGAALLPQLVASEVTTLSICDLASGRRRIVSHPHHAFSGNDLSAFNRHVSARPLVRFRSTRHDGGAHRISRSPASARVKATPLYADYSLRVGLNHSLALPLYVDANILVSFVFNRRQRNFTEGERDLLERIRPVLADLFRASVLLAGRDGGSEWRAATLSTSAPNVASLTNAEPLAALTPREREVVGWVAAGKTNAQIATIVGASVRTVAKHLERVFEKLGVETRTAAAMRVAGTHR
jgi:DNA-binding CsgD family transcriptional regulator